MGRTLTVWLPPEDIEALKLEARKKNISISFLVRYAVEFVLDLEPNPNWIIDFEIEKHQKAIKRLEKERMGG